MKAKFSNSPVELVRAANGSAQKLLEILTTEFKCFDDGAKLEDGTR